MARWFKINPDLLNDYTAHKMTDAEFVRQFDAAARGEQVYLSKFVRPCNGRPGPTEWAKLRVEIFARDDYTCTYCKERGKRLECDHIIPVARGGTHEHSNLTTSCRPCNRAKRDKTLEEWRAGSDQI